METEIKIIDKDNMYVILKKGMYGSHSIFKKFTNWFKFNGKCGIKPNWGGNKPYSPDECFLFDNKKDAEKTLKLIIKNIEYKEHVKHIEIVKWKDIPIYNIVDYLSKDPSYSYLFE